MRTHSKYSGEIIKKLHSETMFAFIRKVNKIFLE